MQNTTNVTLLFTFLFDNELHSLQIRGHFITFQGCCRTWWSKGKIKKKNYGVVMFYVQQNVMESMGWPRSYPGSVRIERMEYINHDFGVPYAWLSIQDLNPCGVRIEILTSQDCQWSGCTSWPSNECNRGWTSWPTTIVIMGWPCY